MQYRAEEGRQAAIAIGHRLLPTPRILDTVLQTEDKPRCFTPNYFHFSFNAKERAFG